MAMSGSSGASATVAKQQSQMSGGYPGRWRGRFVWAPTSTGETPVGQGAYRMFRKTFTIGESVRSVALRITAGDKFQAFCNGVYLGRGPCRSVLPQWSFYDTFDLTSHVRPGVNTISVMVFWHGQANCFSADQRAGLWAEIDVSHATGATESIVSDGTWKTRACRAWDVTAPIVNGAQGLPIECYRAGVDPADWAKTSYNDADWPNAIVLSTANRWEDLADASCWEYLEPRLTPQLDEVAMAPKSILQTGRTTASEDHIAPTAVAERLAKSTYTADATATTTVERLNAGDATFASNAAGDPYIVIDLGRPYNAVPFIELVASCGDVIEMSFSNVLKNGRCAAVEGPSRFAVRYEACDGRQTWQGWNVVTAFRYVTIVFRTTGRTVLLKRCGAVAHIYPTKRVGSFECSDPVLNQVWTAAVETNLMHLQDTYLMDPVRERTYYILAGEMEQSHLSYYVSLGDIAATETHFKLTQRTQLPCGKLPLLLPSAEHRGFPRDERPLLSASYATIPVYATFYSQAILRRQRWFPREAFIDTHYPVLLKIAEWLGRQTDDDGVLYNLPPINWIDWTLYEKWNRLEASNGAILGYNCVYVQFLRDLAEVAGRLEYARDQRKWIARADRVAESIRRRFWNESRGLFVDICNDAGQVDTYSELLNGLALLFNVADASQRARVIDNLKRHDTDVTPVSPLYMFYVAEALCDCDEDAYVFDYMSRRYGPVVGKTDFPTLPEGWGDNAYEADMGFVSIHGGGGGVAFTLSTRILGVTPIADGFSEFRFQPAIGALTHARGTIPSPIGPIDVEWQRSGASLTMSITVPKDSRCHATPPRGFVCETLPSVLTEGRHTFAAVAAAKT